MDPDKFRQGMSHAEAMKNDLGTQALEGEEAYERFYQSYLNLDQRPDWDGFLTYDEAIAWYNKGQGQALYVDARLINLEPISVSDVYHAKGGYLNTAAQRGVPEDTRLVYGTIKFTVTNVSTGAVLLGGRDPQGRGNYLDLYDHGNPLFDAWASLPKGKATPFPIYCSVCTNRVTP
jgi:hypothetical protein